jgi:protein tyrosine/serine phosphatase
MTGLILQRREGPVNRPTPGLINFRDFGGCATAGGARVREDRLYRCGHLANLNDDEIEHVIGLDFAVIADLRYPGERDSERSPWPSDYAERVIAHDGERTHQAPHVALFAAADLGVEALDQFYARIYAELPFDPLYRPLFALTLRRIAEADGRALIHCAAGKDRTGIQAALILHVLGVPREAIIADYLRSSQAPGLGALKAAIMAQYEERHGVGMPQTSADALLGVKPGYIETAFSAIETRSGSIDAYLEASGVDAQVRARLGEQLLV